MSMNTDDLITAYNNGYWSCYEGQQRAGIRAIVEALRDELLRKEGPDTHNLSERIGLRVAVKMFNDILGDAGEKERHLTVQEQDIIHSALRRGVKAAGVPTREDGPDVVISSVQTPAADLGPQDDGILIGNQNVEAIINDLHDEQKNKAAADPSPSEVCEWSVSRDPDGEGHYETQCGNGWMMSVSPPPARDGYNFCPSCGKPIAFKEK